ncbi:hypothetical protein [uncultured Thiothrix sp.]|uniref:hypothetical protein n=1 Tax=uncultured Thiothrix sp. TaxID=223185 RepID=UPI002611E7AE|nr:hypothetical protein [uncultured Thiothrix sp.]
MRSFSLVIGLISLIITSTPSSADELLYVAGTNPAQRPHSAPVLSTDNKDAQWYAHALTGVEQPYPASLGFLEDQGSWFNPFTHAGMNDRYDLRGWHRQSINK